MSLKSNFRYIKDWINAKFLRKSAIEAYYNKEEIDSSVKFINSKIETYTLLKDSIINEEVIASALIDLNNRIIECDNNIKVKEGEEKVIALALSDLNSRINLAPSLDSPAFTGIPTAPTATSGTNSTQIATTAFVNSTVTESHPILGISLNGVAGTLSNKIANLQLTKSSTGAGNIVTDVSIDGTVITVNKSNLPFKANSGSTRPTLTSSDVGYIFLDLSLGTSGKPIWWTGSNWIDATGATV